MHAGLLWHQLSNHCLNNLLCLQDLFLNIINSEISSSVQHMNFHHKNTQQAEHFLNLFAKGELTQSMPLVTNVEHPKLNLLRSNQLRCHISPHNRLRLSSLLSVHQILLLSVFTSRIRHKMFKYYPNFFAISKYTLTVCLLANMRKFGTGLFLIAINANLTSGKHRLFL